MEDKRIAALEEQVQELQKSNRTLQTRSAILSVGVIILSIAVIVGRLRINQYLVATSTCIDDLNNSVGLIIDSISEFRGIDGQIIELLKVFQDLLIRVIDLF